MQSGEKERADLSGHGHYSRISRWCGSRHLVLICT